MLKIISIAPHDFIIAAKIGLDLFNLFIFDQVLHVQHVVVGQKIRPTTAEIVYDQLIFATSVKLVCF